MPLSTPLPRRDSIAFLVSTVKALIFADQIQQLLVSRGSVIDADRQNSLNNTRADPDAS